MSSHNNMNNSCYDHHLFDIPSDFLGILQLLEEKLENKIQAKTSFFLVNITGCLLELLQHTGLQLLQFSKIQLKMSLK